MELVVEDCNCSTNTDITRFLLFYRNKALLWVVVFLCFENADLSFVYLVNFVMFLQNAKYRENVM